MSDKSDAALEKLLATPDAQLTSGQLRIKRNTVSERSRKAAFKGVANLPAARKATPPAKKATPARKASSGSLRGAAKNDLLISEGITMRRE